MNSNVTTVKSDSIETVVDTLITARWVIPVDATDSVLPDHSIAVSGNKIVAVLPSTQARECFASTNVVDLNTHAIIPGLVNAHTHAAMTLFRGTAEDKSLGTWLHEHIWPLEQAWVGSEFVRDGTLLAMAEMIRGGTTLMNDMYMFPELVGELTQATKMRSVLGMIVLEFPTAWAKDSDEYLDKGLGLHRRFENEPLVTTILAPHAPYTVSDHTFERISAMSQSYHLPVHMHVHETANEVEESITQHNVRPIERLHKLGLINSSLIAVHATQLIDSEIELFSETSANVVHCPKSNAKLASGFCPVATLVDNNVNVAIGTDGAASNNSLNMIEEMRFASLLAKGYSQDATALSVNETLRMATINGAKCLGLEAQIGSIECGKLADFVAIDLSSCNSVPCYDPVAQIVHTASREQVTDVWINGNRVLDDSQLTTIDELECKAIASHWQQQIDEKR